MVGANRRVFGYNELHHVPGQLELIDTGISSESESGDTEVVSRAKLQRSPEKVTTPMRVALRRYAVTKDEAIQHLCDQWLPLLTSGTQDGGNTPLEQLWESNALIGIQRRWLSNYECGLLFRHFACRSGENVDKLKRIFVFNLRWWFCYKFGVHLSQFPHLGNEAVLNNATVGILSTIWSRIKLTLHVLEDHDTLGNLFNDVMIPGTDGTGQHHSMGAESCNTLLLRIMPILKRGHMHPDNEAVCGQVLRFIEATSAAAKAQRFEEGFQYSTLHVDPKDVIYKLDETLDELWQGILQCNSFYGNQEQDCSCRSRLGVLLVDIASQVLTSETCLSDRANKPICDILIRRLIGYFSKWVTSKSGTGDLNSFVLGRVASLLLDEEGAKQSISTIRECIDGCSDLNFSLPRDSMKKEPDNNNGDATKIVLHALIADDRFIVESFGRMYTALVGVSHQSYKGYLDIIAGAILLIEDEHLVGDVVFDEGYNIHLMASHLSNTKHGEEVLSKILSKRHTYRWMFNSTNGDICELWEGASPRKTPERFTSKAMRDSPFTLSEQFYSTGLCACFGMLHRELCAAAQSGVTDVLFIPSFANSRSVARMGIDFRMCRHRALHMLQQLCDAIQHSQTSAGNISVTSEAGNCMQPASILVHAVVAVASVMNYNIWICSDDKHTGIVRLSIILDSEHFLSSGQRMDSINWDEYLTVILRLLYSEIATDATMALEYGNDQLSMYRTLLVHCIRGALLKSTYNTFSIDFKCGTHVNFDMFIRRLMRLIFFRVHYMLLEQPKFENFMRLRVLYYNVDKSPDDDQFLEEISRGYLNLGEDDPDKTDSDSDGEFDAEIDYRIFGFLEYSKSHKINHNTLMNGVKRETTDVNDAISSIGEAPPCGEKTGTTMLFFESVFALCGQLRFSIDGDQLFQHNKVDRLLYQMLLHLCHVDNSISNQRNYESNILSNVRRVYETNEYGELLSRRTHLQTFGFGSGNNLATLPLKGDQSSERPMNSCYINLDLLFLNRRKFTKSEYYVLSRMAIESLVRWLSPQSAACALCRWASSIPIDMTSRIKSQKHATAQAIVTMLSLSMLCHTDHASVPDPPVATVESLVSAANVCFVNLKVSFNTVAFAEGAIEIEDDVLGDGSISPLVKEEPADGDDGSREIADAVKIRMKRERPSLSDSSCMDRMSIPCAEAQNGPDEHRMHSYVPGELQLWKQRKLREYRIRQQRLKRMRRELRKNQLIASVHLLQVCVVFVHILGYMMLRTADHILDPANGLVIADGNVEDGGKVCLKNTSAKDAESNGEEGDDKPVNTVEPSSGDSVEISLVPTTNAISDQEEATGNTFISSSQSSDNEVNATDDGTNPLECQMPISTPTDFHTATEPNPKVYEVVSQDGGLHVTASESLPGKVIDEANGMAKAAKAVDNCLQLSTDPNLRAKVESLMQFIILSHNTLDSLFDACTSVSRNCLTDDVDVTVCDNDNVFTCGEEELGLLLHEISFLKEEITSHLSPLLNIHRTSADETAASCVGSEEPVESSQVIRSDISSDDDDDDDDDDDLASFLDFETDSHLGMVTFKESSKRRRSRATRLKDVELRSEWNCLIKSYIS